MTGTDVLNGNKIMNIYAGHDKVYEFKLERNVYQLLNLDSGSMYYLKDNSEQFVNIDVDSDIYKKINSDFDNGKDILITPIKAPIEDDNESDKFNYGELVESYRIDS
ncbi:hypothetical protein Catovirus_1_294 [Catovirus CTV1]|uniref:Translation initiation factor 5A C-terminal domain-containing protein n=1 Tax=Catovirus CTV1 TaxID=1977631 RepID=A0A1V0S975_9VIRU|nr:hypothetical protein Catovirus_1_294 [Catovirus CTV1]